MTASMLVRAKACAIAEPMIPIVGSVCVLVMIASAFVLEAISASLTRQISRYWLVSVSIDR
jgi:hypothetical protein